MLDLVGSNTALLKSILEEMYNSTKSASPKDMFSASAEGFIQDLRLKKLRGLLIKTISDNTSQGELRDLCVRLLLRIGLISASPEDLLLAAKYQFEFKIDISNEL